MSIRRCVALAAVVALVLTLAACGGSGGKSTATKTPKRTAIVLKITPTGTRPANGTPGPTSSGGGTPGSAAGKNSTPQPTPLPGAQRISGTTTPYRVTFTVVSDPGNAGPLVERQRPPTRLSVTIGGGQVSFEGTGSFIRATGPIDASGNFTAKGAGTINPYRNVEVTFTGTLTPEQLKDGSYVIGTNGALPGGQPLTYNVTGAPAAPATQTQP